MRAVICNAFDGPSVLRVGEMPEAELAPGKVRVEIHAASVSFIGLPAGVGAIPR